MPLYYMSKLQPHKSHRRRKRWAKAMRALLRLALVALAAAGCGSVIEPPSVSPSTAPSTETLRLALATSDLAVGDNRIVFGVIDAQTGAVHDAAARVSSFYLPPGEAQQGPIESVDAVFRAWPVSPRGVYTAQLSFDRAGEWGIGVVVTAPDGAERTASARAQVKPQSATPAIGAPAPASVSKTLADVGDISQLTTDVNPDAELYASTIAATLATGKPLVVAFSTPAYCQTATCGPQLDVIKRLKADYGGAVNFIHIEVYDNPREIEGDLSRAVISPTLTEWGLPSEPWTFVMDGGGIVRAKFESFTTREELEAALRAVAR